jgi:glycosyltransferase involved in cell wall biosynthesis
LASCSLIIATYNWPEALRLCLQSVQEQKLLPGEVIVADDGSGAATAELIKEFQHDFPVPLKHIWHPDEGFRLAAIRNKAIAAASTDYIIQIDGDLVLHPWFIADHMEIRKPGYFVAGSRVMLSAATSASLLAKGATEADLQKISINGLRNRLLRSLLANTYKIKGRHKYYVKGCNMAFWKKDLVAVNGYNEAFKGWGSEDREIAIRLINAGIKKQSIKMGAVCYHLYHKLSEKSTEEQNEKIMMAAIREKMMVAPDGLDKYL